MLASEPQPFLTEFEYSSEDLRLLFSKKSNSHATFPKVEDRTWELAIERNLIRETTSLSMEIRPQESARSSRIRLVGYPSS